MSRVLALLLLLVAAPVNALPHQKWVPYPYAHLAAFWIGQASNGGGGGGSLIMPAPMNVSTNWQNAGLAKIGGIPNRSTQCGSTVTPSGITPPATNDDSDKINAAIAACSAGDVVVLAGSTFQISYTKRIVISSGITLRGSGSPTACGIVSPCWPTVINVYDGTWPTYQSPVQCGSSTGVPPSGTSPGSFTSCTAGLPFCGIICVTSAGLVGQNAGWAGCQAAPSGANPTTGNCGTTFTADAAQGDTTISVTSTTNFSVGDWVLIDENPGLVSTSNPVGGGQANIQASPEFLNTSPSPATFRVANPDSSCNYSLCPNRLNAEMHLITAVDAVHNTLTFDSPVTIAFRTAHDARAYWLTVAGSTTKVAMLQQAGIENLTITRATNAPISIEYCAYCWVKNVEAAYWINGIGVFQSPRAQITGSFIHHCSDCANDGAEYPVAMDSATTECLLDNNITAFGGKGMVGRSSNTCVVAYNYVPITRYAFNQAGIGNWFIDMGVNGTHNAGTHHFLFEGNYGDNCDGDETHGNAFYHVFFRNQCSGIRPTFVDDVCSATISDTAGTGATSGACVTSNTPSPRRAGGPMAFGYWYVFASNVMGLSGVTTSGNSWVYFRCQNTGCGGISESDQTIWMSGWTGSEWNYNSDKNLDGTNSPVFLFKNGNYDYVNASVTDNAAGYSQSFPNSLYLNSAPSYFTGTTCTYPWPWVTPAAGSPIQTPTGGGSCSSTSPLPAKARYEAGTPFSQP